MSFFRRLDYLLSARRRKSSAQKRCTLKIPTELVDMILEHLQPESVIAFALTCRALFVKHFPRPAQLSADARATLLQWLEQDIPKLYFCHDCACLHPWRATPFGYYKFYYGVCRSNRPDAIRHIMNNCVSVFKSDLTYCWARLVMNRHLYGARHGPSLRDIEATRRSHDSVYGAIMTGSWSARIIGNNLYVHGTLVCQSDGAKENTQSLRAFIKHYNCFLVCCHVRAAITTDLCRDETSPRPFKPTAGNIQSCPVCFTDYQIRIYLGGSLRRKPRRFTLCQRFEDERWSVEVARWHNLGECRSPHDLEWHNLVTESPYRILVRREDKCGPGTVYRVWMGEDLDPATVFSKSWDDI